MSPKSSKNTAAASPQEDSAPASLPQSTPSRIGYGHPEYNFVQSVMEMQKSIGDVNVNLERAIGQVNASVTSIKVAVDQLTKTVDSTKAKVDELVRWRAYILGACATVGVIFGLLLLAGKGLSDYISIKAPTSSSSTVGASDTPPSTPAAKVDAKSTNGTSASPR